MSFVPSRSRSAVLGAALPAGVVGSKDGDPPFSSGKDSGVPGFCPAASDTARNAAVAEAESQRHWRSAAKRGAGIGRISGGDGLQQPYVASRRAEPLFLRPVVVSPHDDERQQWGCAISGSSS